jgi:RHS repeat-associated protein
LLRRDDGTQYLLHDQQGSTRLITDRLGHVVGGYTYTPYGATISHTGAATSSLRYDGQYQDDETGLYYLQARYYDPTLGQFLTVDPLVNTTRQPYAYALGSPLMGGDPTGLGCGITSFSSIGDCLSDVASAVSGAFEATASGLEQIASGVGQIVGDAATWVKNNPWEAVGIVAGVLAAATGIGAIVDAEIGVGALTLSGAQLGGVSALLGTGAAGLDLNKCLGDHDVAACTGAALGGVSALATLPELFAIAGGAEDDGILLGALHGLAAAGGAFGISSLLVDIIDAFSDGPLC